MKEVELINEVGAWAEKQPWHPRHAPELGVIEEIGEAAHAELKHFQRIREMEDVVLFHEAFADAIGDAMIYLSHWCYLHNAYFQFEKIKKPAGKNWVVDAFPTIMQHLLQAVSAMYSQAIEGGDVAIASHVAQRIVTGLAYWAAKYDFDLALITSGTWAKVSKRDWNKHPDGWLTCPRCQGDATGCETCGGTGRVKVG